MFLSPRKKNIQKRKLKRKNKKKLKSEILYDRYIPRRKESKLQVAYEKGAQDSNDEENKQQIDQ